MVDTVLETWDVALLSDDILVNTCWPFWSTNPPWSAVKIWENGDFGHISCCTTGNIGQHDCVGQNCVDQKYDASAFKNRVERVSIIPRSFYNFLQRNNVFSGQSSAENRPMSTFSVIFSTMRSRGVLSISATKRYHISPQNPKYSTGNTSSFIPPQGHL